MYVLGQLWLYRTKPRDDELFSSWIVRLAWGLAIRLQTFCVRILGARSGFWGKDIDRDINSEMISRLAVGAAVDPRRIQSMAFAALGELLWEEYRPHGSLPWITTLARWGRRRTGYGQQYCRLCLANDEVPYFRRRWRFAFNVACSEHHIYLRDQCGLCSSPVEFHVGDFGKVKLHHECPLVFCGTCGFDLRDSGRVEDIPSPPSLNHLQQLLNNLLIQGCHDDLPGAMNYPHLFFDGFRLLISMLTSRGRTGRLREFMLLDLGLLPFSIEGKRSGVVFEELRVGDRALILDLCTRLLDGWPTLFVSLCKQSRVSSSYIRELAHYKMPYWFDKVVRWHLDDSDYAPSIAEKESAKRFLLMSGRPVSKNAVNELLGVAHVSAQSRSKRKRWNPRGPKKLH